MLSVRLAEGMAARLEAAAARTGRSKSYCVRLAIGEWLDAQDAAASPARPRRRAEGRGAEKRPASGRKPRGAPADRP